MVNGLRYSNYFPTRKKNDNPGFEFDPDVTIYKDVWIGTRSIILSGVTSGENSVITANEITSGVQSKIIRKKTPIRKLKRVTYNERK